VFRVRNAAAGLTFRQRHVPEIYRHRQVLIADHTQPERNLKIRFAGMILASSCRQYSTMKPETNPNAPRPRPLRILLVDDHTRIGAALVELLFAAGHTVQLAVNGADAWDVILDHFDDIDLVVTDHQMPGLSGLEICQLLRQTTYRGGLMVHSSALTTETQASYLALKVDAIVPKSTTARELLAAVEAFKTSRQNP